MDNIEFVLDYCMKRARLGEREISVFDLMYEGIVYTDLKPALDELASRGEIEIIDIKTFKFIGEIVEYEHYDDEDDDILDEISDYFDDDEYDDEDEDEDEDETPLEIPAHPSWSDEFEFIRTVRQKKEEIVKSDKNMGVKGAIKKAETFLEDITPIANSKLIEVYKRLIFELQHTTPYEYNKLKKKYFQ